MLRLNTTTMRPKESIQICIEEKVPLFCAGLGNPGFMVENAHAVGMKVLAITGNAKNAKRMAESGVDPLPFPTQVLISSALIWNFVEGNKFDYVGGLAGQISGIISEIKPARQVLKEMVEEVVDILTRKLPETVTAK